MGGKWELSTALSTSSDMVTFVTFFITSNEIYDDIDFGFQILVLSYSCSQRPLNYSAFQSFDFERTC